MPAKHEHVLTCRLSKRQRQLYDEYMERAETRDVMSGGNFMGVINVLMQLRKVGTGANTDGLDFVVGAVACGGWPFRLPVQLTPHNLIVLSFTHTVFI